MQLCKSCPSPSRCTDQVSRWGSVKKNVIKYFSYESIFDLMHSDFRRDICFGEVLRLRTLAVVVRNDNNKGKPRYTKKKVPVSTSSTTKPTWNPVLCTEILTTNDFCLTAKFVAYHFTLHVSSGRTCHLSRKKFHCHFANLYIFHQDRFIKSIMSFSETFRRH